MSGLARAAAFAVRAAFDDTLQPGNKVAGSAAAMPAARAERVNSRRVSRKVELGSFERRYGGEASIVLDELSGFLTGQ